MPQPSRSPFDLTAFPDLFDDLLTHAHRSTLLTLRTLSRETLSAVDNYLFYHIKLGGEPWTPVDQWLNNKRHLTITTGKHKRIPVLMKWHAQRPRDYSDAVLRGLAHARIVDLTWDSDEDVLSVVPKFTHVDTFRHRGDVYHPPIGSPRTTVLFGSEGKHAHRHFAFDPFKNLTPGVERAVFNIDDPCQVSFYWERWLGRQPGDVVLPESLKEMVYIIWVDSEWHLRPRPPSFDNVPNLVEYESVIYFHAIRLAPEIKHTIVVNDFRGKPPANLFDAPYDEAARTRLKDDYEDPEIVALHVPQTVMQGWDRTARNVEFLTMSEYRERVGEAAIELETNFNWDRDYEYVGGRYKDSWEQ